MVDLIRLGTRTLNGAVSALGICCIASGLLLTAGCESSDAAAGPANRDGSDTQGAGATPGGGDDDLSSNGGANVPGTGAFSGDGLPCDVASIVRSRCGLCHGSPASYGAPMSLATHEDFSAPAPSDTTKTSASAALTRIQATDASERMPPVGQPQLSSDELATLTAWLSKGAQAGEDSCEGAETDGGTPPPTRDDTLTCYSLLAHKSGDKEAPYPVGVAVDSYVNFTFMPEWDGTLYAHELHTVIDNPQAVHHWLLYKNTTAGTDGAVTASSGAHPGGELVFGWAPGGGDLYLDTLDASGDVGIRLEGDVSYTLELHYNSSDASAVDRSGVELCGRMTEPANVAADAWLGTDLIFGTSATGTCDPLSEEPIHIIGIAPHMHTKGTHMRAVITRADGSTETLHDGAFDFNYQTLYPKDVWLMPGDSVTTTCTYGSFATFGESTNSEMCYLFTLHTPGGALSDNGPYGTAAHGDNACLGI